MYANGVTQMYIMIGINSVVFSYLPGIGINGFPYDLIDIVCN